MGNPGASPAATVPAGASLQVTPPGPPQRDGDGPATEPFEVFYRAYADRVYRALAVTLRDAHLARDAVDEAMARAYAHWRRGYATTTTPAGGSTGSD